MTSNLGDALRNAGMDVPAQPERENTEGGNPERGNNMAAQCRECKKQFNPRQPNHRLCDDCHNKRLSGNPPSQSGRNSNPVAQPSLTPRFPDVYFHPDAQERNCLRSDFVSKKNVDPLARELGQRTQPRLTTSQMRRFFNYCRDIERRLKTGGESWQQVAADFERLSSHAQYAHSSGKIPAGFQTFIDDNVKRVTSSGDPSEAFLKGFLLHFEALVGFGSAYMRNN